MVGSTMIALLAIELVGALTTAGVLLWNAPVKRVTGYGWLVLASVSVLWLPACCYIFVTGRTKVLDV